jgi:hypothetical protein
MNPTSLYNAANDGSTMSVLARLTETVGGHLTGVAKNLGSVTHRLGTAAAMTAVMGMTMMAGAANAQLTSSDLNRALESQAQQNRILNATQQVTNVVSHERGLDYSQRNMANAAGAVAAAVSSNSKTASIAGAVVGLGGVMMQTPRNQQVQTQQVVYTQPGGYYQPQPVYHQPVYQKNSYNNGQGALQVVAQQFVQQSNNAYNQAVSSNISGNFQARDQAAQRFAVAWGGAVASGVDPRQFGPDTVQKFNVLQNIAPGAMQQGFAQYNINVPAGQQMSMR